MTADQPNATRSSGSGLLWRFLCLFAIVSALGGLAISWWQASEWKSQVRETSRKLDERSADAKKTSEELQRAERDVEQLRKQLVALQAEMPERERRMTQQVRADSADLERRASANIGALSAQLAVLKEHLDRLVAQEEHLAKILAVQQIRELKNPSAQIRQQAADSLLGLGPRARSAVVALERAAKDIDPGVRSRAAAALKALGPVPPLEHLLLRLRDPDELADARRTTVRELAQNFWAEPIALQALKELSQDPQIQADVEQAIQAIGSRRFVLEHSDWVDALDFSPDGKFLAASCFNRKDKRDYPEGCDIHLWDLSARKRVRVLKDLPLVPALAFSPEGKMLALACKIQERQQDGYFRYDREVQLWDPHSGKKLRTLAIAKDHLFQINSLAFSPDGRFLAWGGSGVARYTGAGDQLRQVFLPGVLSVWDVQKGEIYATIEPGGFKKVTRCLAFDAEGKTLAIVSQDDSPYLPGQEATLL